ncbi:penicillin-binding protein 1A [Marinobacterium arenosum]|uniref:penicillin-binding protein 1A n=1 Tax=Marinobacterium arenosum TaxID=2862496 RepID=UPI0028F43AC8|nr:penicillin-binding protein 1A [Marinobacterium arenosum]
METLRDVQFQTPLRVYSADQKLIAEFGEKRRTPISVDQIPEQYVQALLAAEDSRFYKHVGIDIKGLLRAAVQLATTGHIQSGGSTITMQVAKNFFLTRERTFKRKFMEILLALRIEQELSKDEILELYVNKIYLGHRAYGIQAAATVYYGTTIDQLSLAQLAMIAGLPKAPSAYNPITNPERALERRNWILQRMHALAYIDDESYEIARQSPVTARYHGSDIELQAPYIAEMVRAELYAQYGDNLYTDGYRVYTTLDSRMQNAAYTALQNGLLAYTERHGYRGPEKQLQLASIGQEKAFAELQKFASYGDVEPALVLSVAERSAELVRKSGERVSLDWDALSWARKYLSVNGMGPRPKTAADVLTAGDIVRIRPRQPDQKQDQPAQTAATATDWQLTQLPQVQGAFVALDPKNGAIRALLGGFNFHHNKFNRAVQANRQPGSNFKPFIYTAALNQGYTPATLINDAPVVFHDDKLEASWRPQNYSKKFFGPTRLREALYRSRNMVSIRILQGVGINNARSFLTKFGFDAERLPSNLSLSLGSADVTPLEIATGYAVFANGGFKVNPHFISRVEDAYGKLITASKPATVCEDCVYLGEQADGATPAVADGQQVSPYPLAERILDKQVGYLIYNIMQDVIKRGTGRRAKVLKRNDLAGKTGTTNDQKDAWFSGFNGDLVATTWVGFDQPQTLGRSEYGSRAALPIWVDFMRVALDGAPENAPVPPDGIVTVKIDPKTGLLAYPGQEDAIFEVFREDNAPTRVASTPGAPGSTAGGVTEELF